MTKKKEAAKNKERKIVALVIFGVFVLILSWLIVMTIQTRNDLKQMYSLKMALLVNAAVDNLSRDIPKDPKTGEQFLPEAKLRIPAATNEVNRLKYNVIFSENTTVEEIRLTNISNLEQAKVAVIAAQTHESMFDAIPELQACSRGYAIRFSDETAENEEKVLRKILSDGREIVISKEKACRNNHENIAAYLSHIDSY